MKEVTLPVNVREMTFSEQEQSSILGKHFSNNATTEATTDKVAQRPTEDRWFEVKPKDIDPKLFEKKKKDQSQEATRQLILEAFAEMKGKPEKYGRNFKTMMPKKTWTYKPVVALKEMSSNLGDHNADWVEQALEWAQRIANGESWEAICNNHDTANWYRLVVWKNGHPRLVGGSLSCLDFHPASDANFDFGISYSNLIHTVPLVVLYE